MKKAFAIALGLFFISIAARAQEHFPKSGWSPTPNPMTSSNARTGGEISVFLGQYPKSLNYYLDASTQSAQIFGALFETLLSMNPLTLEYEPALARRWTISADKQTFTFFLDPAARWSDGRPITAHDVRWTFDAIMDPKNLTGPHKIDMERFEPPEVLDDHTIVFKAKNVHWKNLGAAGGFFILSRRAYGKKDFNKINFEFPVVSGPYGIEEIREGQSVILKHRPNWWDRDDVRFEGTGNFDRIRFKFFAERENAFEAFTKEKIDLFPVYTSRLWVNETKGDKFINNWIVKQKVYNAKPVGFQGFAMNMRKPPFDDLKVRKAMAHLLDREKMNAALMYNQYFLHRSYYEDLYDDAHPCPNPVVRFDKNDARRLLKEAGWQTDPETGFLMKNNKRFSFKFLTRSASSEKFLSIYAEDLKDVGIELIIDKKDWAAWAKDMDEFNFDMTWAAWGSGIFKDPEGMWSSREADRQGSSNITGFRDSRVDALIEAQKSIFDIHQRNALNRKIDRILYDAFPYVLLWNINYTRLLYWNKFGTPPTVLPKYGDESSAYWYWWMDLDSAAVLKDALETGLPLPHREPVIHFQDHF
jgi:microcin C transport system substrate-binding protein